MSMTKAVEASIQAVSPESILASELDDVAGLAVSESASARTIELDNKSADVTSSASSECFTKFSFDVSGAAPEARQYRRREIANVWTPVWSNSCAGLSPHLHKRCKSLICKRISRSILVLDICVCFRLLPALSAFRAWKFSTVGRDGLTQLHVHTLCPAYNSLYGRTFRRIDSGRWCHRFDYGL